jgi:hypothetical protein
MTNVPDPGESPDNPPKPTERPGPKRGAFPAPKSEIEKAEPYVPDIGDEEGCPEGNPDRPVDIEGEKGGDPDPRPFDPSEELVSFKSMQGE